MKASESTRRQGTRAPDSKGLVLRFVLRFFAFVFLISVLARVDLNLFEGAANRALTHQSAWVVASTLSLFGADVTRRGATIVYRSSAFKIIDECTGVEVIGLFVAAILAFPSAWRHRLLGLALGIPALLVLNLIRMVSLIFIGAGSTKALDFGHVYVWPVIVLTMALGIWLYWARIAVRDPHTLV
jgi:exosortase H (IPTLxxWG-CTERM-specific)